MNADTERLARAIHERKRMLHEFGPECICTRDAEAILRGAAKIAPPLNVEKIIAEWADRPPEPPSLDPNMEHVHRPGLGEGESWCAPCVQQGRSYERSHGPQSEVGASPPPPDLSEPEWCGAVMATCRNEPNHPGDHWHPEVRVGPPDVAQRVPGDVDSRQGVVTDLGAKP